MGSFAANSMFKGIVDFQYLHQSQKLIWTRLSWILTDFQ